VFVLGGHNYVVRLLTFLFRGSVSGNGVGYGTGK